jgi:archaeal type IV pilus assembly protein PilA
MSRMQKNDSAVSPVIGVMLMIVVTIIIAAVVAAFSGGISSDQKKTPNAVFTVAGVSTSDGTVTFQQTGGDELALNEILIQIQYNGQSITLSNADKMTGSAGGHYLTEVGGTSDGYISASDRFTLTADSGTSSSTQFKYQPSDAVAAFTIPVNAHVSYMIIDKTSGKSIQNGEFVLRNS